MPPIKVTVIIPVYNCWEYLEKCLKSVINQSLQELEIICIDDASTDDSPEILKKFARKDKRIEVLTIKKAGQGVARNMGIEIAKGTFIGFLDADDQVSPEMFEVLYNEAVNTKSEISYCMTDCFEVSTGKTVPFAYFDTEKEMLTGGRETATYNRDEFYKLLPYTTVVAWNKLYRTNFLHKYNVRFAERLIQEDIPFTFQALLNASRITVVKKSFCKHGLDRSSSTMNTIAEHNHRHIFEILRITEESVRKQLQNSTALSAYNLFKIKELTDSLNRVFRSNSISPDSKNRFFNDVKSEFIRLKRPPGLDVFYKMQFILVRTGMRRLFTAKVRFDLIKEQFMKE